MIIPKVLLTDKDNLRTNPQRTHDAPVVSKCTYTRLQKKADQMRSKSHSFIHVNNCHLKE